MLCYRCGSHVPENVETCPACGQKLTGSGLRQATGTFSRRRAASGSIEGAPYKVQDLVANRYLIKDIVGQGPLGHVFRAHDKEIDVEVALKVINPRLVQTAEERKQFSKVMRSARKLSHPNVVRVYEEGEDAERPYFTSQFLDGLSLRKIIELRLQKGQFFALNEIEPILTQICAALDGAHKVGPHTDLKPDNVLVLPDLLKVTDFGLGVAMPRPPFVQAMKARKADRYLAPELIEGSEVDLRCDVYSAGVILGEMLSGLTPDDSIPELGRKNPEVPVAVEGFYRKALNSNPNARFKTVEEFIGEFIELTRKYSPVAAPSGIAKPESAAGGPGPLRRTTTGMLQLQPRRPTLDVPIALPPPPPPGSGESVLPADATQPVDPAMLKIALERPLFGTPGEKRDDTDVIDSGQFLRGDSGESDAPEAGPRNAEPQPGLFGAIIAGHDEDRPSRTWLYVLLLVVLGVGVGAGAGLYLVDQQKETAELQRTRDAEEKVKAEQAQKAERLKDEVARKAAEAAKLTDAKLAEQTSAEKAAAERAAAMQKANTERARVLAEKQAADKTSAEKAAAEKAQKLADERAAAVKAAAERAAAAAERKPPLVATVTPRTSNDGCPENMKAVATGPFKMGTSRDDPMMGFDEKPLAVVEVAAYCIDAYEFPNRRGVAPMVAVAWADAKRQCESVNKRLCSEAEWEKACKGPSGARWPYGNTFDASACNTEDDTGEARPVSAAGKFGRCRSGYGLSDLSGNVAEWTSDKMIKGGSFQSSDYAVRCSARKNGAAFAKSSEVGFRCCTDFK